MSKIKAWTVCPDCGRHLVYSLETVVEEAKGLIIQLVGAVVRVESLDRGFEEVRAGLPCRPKEKHL